MRNCILKLLAMASALASLGAHAQTYTVDITMSGIQPAPTTFAGSFTFNPAATGACSAAFCGLGVTPEFSNVKIGDPISGGAFTDVVGGQSSLRLYDTYFGVAGQSSLVYSLSFNLKFPLTSGQTNVGISDVVFQTGPNVTGLYACDPSQYGGLTHHSTCATSVSIAPKAAAAPEIDPASASAGLAMLFGGIAVLRGRRRLDLNRNVAEVG